MKTDQYNPFLAFMPNPELMRKTAQAWAMAIPTMQDVQANPFTAAVNSSVASFDAYSKIFGSLSDINIVDEPLNEPEEAVAVQPVQIEKPETPSDLKKIPGVGPKLETVLNSLGIWTYEQIAGWSEAEIAWLDDFLQFSGRIERDGWIDEAKALAAAQ